MAVLYMSIAIIYSHNYKSNSCAFACMYFFFTLRLCIYIVYLDFLNLIYIIILLLQVFALSVPLCVNERAI